MTTGNAESTRTRRLLIVEDNIADAELLAVSLRRARPGRHQIVHAVDLHDGLRRLDEQEFDVILLDLSVPGHARLSALDALLDASPTATIVVLSGMEDEQLAIDAVRSGAEDFLMKHHASPELVSRAIEFAIARTSRGRPPSAS